MPLDTPRLFAPIGHWCERCILLTHCGSETSEQACTPTFNPAGVAGPHLLHPARPDFEAEFEKVGGIAFDDLQALPQTLPTLPLYLPQVLWVSTLAREALAPKIVGIRLDQVTIHGRIRSATELCEHIGIPPATPIVLLLFTYDRDLEEFASRDARALDELAVGGYAAVTTPSYSIWTPRRRPNNLLSLRRSMLTVEALQSRGIPTIPRMGWVEDQDVIRLANWLNNNHAIETVAIDLMGYQKRDFERHTALLARFDELTERRLRYLVNGLNSFERICETYLAISPERVTVSDATLPRLPRRGGNGKPQRGFRARVRASEDKCIRARELVQLAARRGVEEVVERAGTAATRRAEVTALLNPEVEPRGMLAL